MNPYHEHLLAAAAEGALILTANKRLARHLGRLYDEGMASAGRQVWPTPAVHSAESWQQQTLLSLDQGWRVLPSAAAQRLWEEVVEADSAESGLGLLQVAASARRAREAHELLVEYGADSSAWPLTDDHQAFLRWRERFRAACTAGGWLDPGPYGCLGTAPGYALAAGLLHPGRQIVVLLGDGAAGFGMGDWDTLVRFGVDVTMVCGNNGIWGLEKHPMQFVYGYDVAAELQKSQPVAANSNAPKKQPKHAA